LVRLDFCLLAREPVRDELLDAQLEVELELIVDVGGREVSSSKCESERAANPRTNLEAHFPQSLYPESGGRMSQGAAGVKRRVG
jgi:hypothetical protein